MTTLRIKSCQEAFKKGLADRKKYPFRDSSLYKIREFQRRLELFPDNLINIGKCSLGKKKACYSLRGCVSFDKAVYTKKMPYDIAYDLAFKVVSALPSLKYVGLAQHDLDRITAYVNSKIQGLIDLAGQASVELQNNWKHSARCLAAGEGALVDLVFAALALLNCVLGEVEACKKLP